MRGIGHTFSRLPAARAFLAGAALLAGAMFSAAQAQATGSGNGDESAMAVPRIAMRGGSGVAFPQPLAPSDTILIRRIFALQHRGRLEEATRDIERLVDTSLIGHILAQRYLGRFHHSTVPELTEWMARFSDQPDAPAIRDLLIRRAPKGTVDLPEPEIALLSGGDLPDPLPGDNDRQERGITRNPVLDRSVAERARAGNADAALRLITRTPGLSVVYGMQLRAEVAQILFTQNQDRQALDVAADAMQRGHAEQQVALAGYIAGLASWRLDRPEAARRYFERAAIAPITTGAQRAAAAFWAARAHMRVGDPAGYAPWMRLAGREKRTFHGQLARSILGRPLGSLRRPAMLGEADVEAIAATTQGLRAFALLQVGQNGRAEAELRALWPLIHDSPRVRRSLLLVAQAAGLTELSTQLAALIQIADGHPRDELRFPVPTLKPRGGFRVDPALVYALTRIESNFDTTAVSPMGARGLMQIMPMTAQYVAAMDGGGDAPPRLHEPARNLELGQRYLTYLAEYSGIDGDLIRVLSSYNSGPGSFARWGPEIRDDGDPLLFIEAIPNAETRRYVQHALAYSWLYAARLGLPSPSLAELAAGSFPRFAADKSSASVVDADASTRLN